MGASSGLTFLLFFRIMDRLGMKISCVPFGIGESEVPMKFGICRVNLVIATAVFTSHGEEPSLPVRLNSLVVQKMRAPLRTASVMIFFGITSWRAPKFSQILVTSSVTS